MPNREKTMSSGWRRYLQLHAVLAAAAAGFLLFAWLAGRFLPAEYFHCLSHDVLRLYCPLCGGTRAARALLAFDPLGAFLLAPTVFLLLIAVAALDVRAFLLLCRKSEKPLLPQGTALAVGAGLLLATCLRNALMLCGVDGTGELAAFWSCRLSFGIRATACALSVLLGSALTLGVAGSLPGLPARWQRRMLLAALPLGVLLCAVLWIPML